MSRRHLVGRKLRCSGNGGITGPTDRVRKGLSRGPDRARGHSSPPPSLAPTQKLEAIREVVAGHEREFGHPGSSLQQLAD